MLMMWHILLITVLSYLIGAIPTAFLIARYIHRKNIFILGSGNMGGTNVARAMGLHWGILTVALDALKGMVAVSLAQQIMPEAALPASVLASIMAVVGHSWSAIATALYRYYTGKFEIKGGKGGATAYGTMIMMLPPTPIIMVLVVGIGLAILTRYASLAVLVSFAVSLTWALLWAFRENDARVYVPYIFGIAILIIWRFRENIQRLLSGTERKLGERVA